MKARSAPSTLSTSTPPRARSGATPQRASKTTTRKHLAAASSPPSAPRKNNANTFDSSPYKHKRLKAAAQAAQKKRTVSSGKRSSDEFVQGSVTSSAKPSLPRTAAKRSSSTTRKKSEGNAVSSGVDAVLRLNKFLADAGVCSRRDADELIAQGFVKVNGEAVTELGRKVHLSDLVTVRGEPVNAEKHLTYLVLNKPKDTITTTSDEKGRKTVMDVLPSKIQMDERLYPVGRLDRNTTGVLLLTNDGELAHRLTHPSYQIPRVYSIGLDKRLTAEHARQISKGVAVEGEHGEHYVSAPCELLIDPDDHKHVTLQIAEGKNREIRRIFDAMGYAVEKLDRKLYATVSTRGLARGEYRHLTREEVRELEMAVGLEHRYEQAAQKSQRSAAQSKPRAPKGGTKGAKFGKKSGVPQASNRATSNRFERSERSDRSDRSAFRGNAKKTVKKR